MSSVTERRDARLLDEVCEWWHGYAASPEGRRRPRSIHAALLERFGHEVGRRVGQCRGCGTVGLDFDVADGQEWVMDSDDVGYPYCPKCIEGYTAEVRSWSS